MSLGGLDGFGSFNGKASIRRKGAGSSSQNKAYYDTLLAEAEYKEAKQTKDKLIEELDPDSQEKSEVEKMEKFMKLKKK